MAAAIPAAAILLPAVLLPVIPVQTSQETAVLPAETCRDAAADGETAAAAILPAAGGTAASRPDTGKDVMWVTTAATAPAIMRATVPVIRWDARTVPPWAPHLLPAAVMSAADEKRMI